MKKSKAQNSIWCATFMPIREISATEGIFVYICIKPLGR